jgi:hypothetical protein
MRDSLADPAVNDEDRYLRATSTLPIAAGLAFRPQRAEDSGGDPRSSRNPASRRMTLDLFLLPWRLGVLARDILASVLFCGFVVDWGPRR